jgi:hypothetical protein
MDIDVFPPQELDTVFRVLRTALDLWGPLGAHERAFLETYAKITGYALGDSDPPPIAACDVGIEGAHPRKRLVQLAAIATLLNRPVKRDSIAFLRELSRRLAAHDPVIGAIEALREGRHLRIRLLTMRRLMRTILKDGYRAEGFPGVARFLGAMFLGTTVNKDKVWRYRRLGLLPEGTLGREYWKHMTRVGFGFPGEAGGIPDSIAYHDVGHILAGNDTTPLGEIQQGSFQGGNRREDGFAFVQFVLLQFHQGVKVTPATAAAVGNFDPRKVLWAIHRGARCNVDITHQWNFWPLMPLPIEQARARCGLLPKEPAAADGPRDARSADCAGTRRVLRTLSDRRCAQACASPTRRIPAPAPASNRWRGVPAPARGPSRR